MKPHGVFCASRARGCVPGEHRRDRGGVVWSQGDGRHADVARMEPILKFIRRRPIVTVVAVGLTARALWRRWRGGVAMEEAQEQAVAKQAVAKAPTVGGGGNLTDEQRANLGYLGYVGATPTMVLEFQRAYNQKRKRTAEPRLAKPALVEDGIYGPRTRAALEDAIRVMDGPFGQSYVSAADAWGAYQ